MKSIVIYTLDSCIGCMKCLRACPTGAISIKNDRVFIDGDKCINCSSCIDACQNHGLTAKGSSINEIANYELTVCLVPSAFVHYANDEQDVSKLFHSIKELGFDEVVDMSAFEAELDRNFLKEEKDGFSIRANCPVIKRLIKNNHPMLTDNISDLDYPSEVAARYYRNKHQDKNIGIFLLCECGAKLSLAKYPYGNEKYEVDHALAVNEIFPLLQFNINRGKDKQVLNSKGLACSNIYMYEQKEDHLLVDGIHKCINVIELLDFDRLKKYNHYSLYACFNGCIGGDLLWGNSYAIKDNYKKFMAGRSAIPYLNHDDLLNPRYESNIKRNFKEEIERYNKVSEILNKLPGYDCSACGYQDCQNMAEACYKGEAKIDNCMVLKAIGRRENEGK